MTDLHLVVGGLLTRDPVLAPLLLNYAAALQWAQPPASSCIVPSWAADEDPGALDGGELFTVEGHVSREAPHPHRCLDTVLDTVHAALTRGPISVQRLADTDVPDIGGGTVSRVATWALTLAAPDVLGRPASGYRPSGAASSNR